MAKVEIELSPEQMKNLIESCRAEMKTAEHEKHLAQIKIDRATKTIESLLRALTNMDGRPNESDYNSSFTVLQKIKYALNRLNAFSTSSQIVDLIDDLEGNKDRTTLMKSISSVLSVNSSGDKAIFIKSQNERGQTIYNLR